MRSKFPMSIIAGVRSLALAFTFLGVTYAVLWTLGDRFERQWLGFSVGGVAAIILVAMEGYRCGMSLAFKRVVAFILFAACLLCSVVIGAYAYYRESWIALVAMLAVTAAWWWVLHRFCRPYLDWSDETLRVGKTDSSL